MDDNLLCDCFIFDYGTYITIFKMHPYARDVFHIMLNRHRPKCIKALYYYHSIPLFKYIRWSSCRY